MLCRSLAMFFAILCALGAAARVSGGGFDPTPFWLDLRPLEEPGSTLLLVVAMIALGAFGLGTRSRWLALLVWLLAAIALVDAIRFYALIHYGRIESSFPVAMSLLICAAFAVLAWKMSAKLPRGQEEKTQEKHRSADDAFPASAAPPRSSASSAFLAPWRLGVHLLLIGAWATLFALSQMWCYGKTDYSRPADAIVVLGARVYDDGRLSDALADRVRTGVKLFHERRAPLLIMSGGPDEPGPMRDFAMSLDVPESAIELDPAGVNTRATIDYLSRNHRADRVLAVSHFYHLPRIQLAATQSRLHVLTVPADESYTLSQMPRYVAREVVAFWVYLFA